MLRVAEGGVMLFSDKYTRRGSEKIEFALIFEIKCRVYEKSLYFRFDVR